MKAHLVGRKSGRELVLLYPRAAAGGSDFHGKSGTCGAGKFQSRWEKPDAPRPGREKAGDFARGTQKTLKTQALSD
jgi:hypothetical protein